MTEDELLDEYLKEQPEYPYVKNNSEYREMMRDTYGFKGVVIRYHGAQLLSEIRKSFRFLFK